MPLNHCLILQFKPERINIERNNTLQKIKIKANYKSIVNYKKGKLILLVNHLHVFSCSLFTILIFNFMDILMVLNVYTDVALTFAALRNHSVRLRCSAGTCPAYSAFRFKSSCYQGRCQCNGENYQQKNCLRTLLFENCQTH